MKIPYSICGYVLSNQHLVEPLRLFLNLKYETSTGRILKPKLDRTKQKHFENLKSEKWLNQKNEILFLRKFATIQRYYKLKGKQTINIKKEFTDSKEIFTAYLAAIIFKAINKKNRWKKKRGTPAVVSGNGHSTRPLLPKINYSNAISVRYFAAYLGISVGKAYKLKTLAYKYKFIKITRKEREFEFYTEGKLHSPNPIHLKAIFSEYPFLSGRVFKKNGELFYRQPDQIFTMI